MSTTANAPKKKSLLKKIIIFGIVGFIGLILFAGCVAAVSGSSEPESEPNVVATETTEPQTVGPPESTAPETTEPKSGATVEMRATATGGGNVYWDVEGGSNSVDFIDGWTETVEGIDRFDYFYFSVSPNFMSSDENSVVTCELYVDGELVDKATGTGEMGSASCSTL